MEQHGFIHDMLDVKVLLLYLMSRVQYPVNVHQVFELAYQDDCLSYFDVAEALPQMVEDGHLTVNERGEYAITPKGVEIGKLTDDALAYPVMQRVQSAVDRFNRMSRRDEFIQLQIEPAESGDFTVTMSLSDEFGSLMTLSMAAPNRKQAQSLSRALHSRADRIYQAVMAELLDEPEGTNA